jgi:RNA polymerase sigma-70 factor (ECF subfamily)
VPATFVDVLTIVSPGDVCPRDDRAALAEASDRLVVSARAGNRDAFGDLVVLHQRAAYRAAFAALGSPEDAEDAVQEAFVIAWRKLPGFRGEASFRTWLLTIVWRKSLDRRRMRRSWWSRLAHARIDDDAGHADARDLLDTIEHDSADPEELAQFRDLARQTRREIARLSPKLKDALLLAVSGQHTYEEIGAMLGIPLGTVKWRVAEARRLLKERVTI